MNIRTLRADEIEVRVGNENKTKTGMSLLLYKDARCDMRILDEAFGYDGWQREHQVIDGKLFCTLKVWSDKMNQWICKQDVGTESNAEAEKGQASDSFKRACFNLGIGRELYTSPFIWISYSKGYNKHSKFKVKEIGYNDRKEINLLTIEDEEGKEAFKYFEGRKNNTVTEKNATEKQTKNENNNLISEAQSKRLFMLANGKNPNEIKNILKKYGFNSSKEITKDKYNNICKEIEGLESKAIS